MARLLWTQRQQVGPAPRRGHSMAFDSTRSRVVLFGGTSTGATFGDTWEWGGESWTQMDDIGPTARAMAAMAYDAVRRRTVLFGGTDASGSRGDTWERDGDDWTQVAEDGPAARDGAAMVHDASRRRILPFGGCTSSAPASFAGDSREWDGDEWVQVQDTGPAPRSGHAMAFDAARGRAVLYGSADDTHTFGDTWEWDREAWSQVAAFGPPELGHATLIWNGRRCVLFGGASDLATPPADHGDTWEQFERGGPLRPPPLRRPSPARVGCP